MYKQRGEGGGVEGVMYVLKRPRDSEYAMSKKLFFTSNGLKTSIHPSTTTPPPSLLATFLRFKV